MQVNSTTHLVMYSQISHILLPSSIPYPQVNLSCNFFKGSFDVPRYIDFVHQYWTLLARLEAEKGIFGYNGSPAEATTASGGGGDGKTKSE